MLVWKLCTCCVKVVWISLPSCRCVVRMLLKCWLELSTCCVKVVRISLRSCRCVVKSNDLKANDSPTVGRRQVFQRLWVVAGGTVFTTPKLLNLRLYVVSGSHQGRCQMGRNFTDILPKILHLQSSTHWFALSKDIVWYFTQSALVSSRWHIFNFTKLWRGIWQHFINTTGKFWTNWFSGC